MTATNIFYNFVGFRYSPPKTTKIQADKQKIRDIFFVCNQFRQFGEKKFIEWVSCLLAASNLTSRLVFRQLMPCSNLNIANLVKDFAHDFIICNSLLKIL